MNPSQSLRSVALVTVTAAATLLLIQACGGGAVASENDRDPLQGAWDATVTVRDCATSTAAATFKALLLVHQGGTVNVDATSAPSLRGAIFGTWARGSTNNYTADVSHFRYNPDGTLAGITKIQRTVVLGSDANSYTANLRVRVLGNDGTVLSEVCPTEAATRATP